MPKFYLTTPIYYVNDRPHIGHAYATFAADVLARYRRMLGDEVYFLTGTDENAQKNVKAAHKAGSVDIQEYVDRMSAVWQETWKELNVSNNDFIRTTESRHIVGVEKFWHAVEAAGDIYKGTYEGLYCLGCEAFKTESELVDGLCPDHHEKPELLKEENYFFRLSKYRDALLKHIDEHPDFILPASRRNEIINYIRDHLNDTSISRPTKGWGIPVPGDSSQVMYVWFDALINYLTAVGYGLDDERFKKWWPADLHLVGKDIIKFHCALWPAMLMSAGLSLPKHVFAHGFFTIDDKKISKSLGNAIDPRDLIETYGLETLRYFLLREIPFGGDGDFSIERIAARYDADLASGLGNTVSRILTLAVDRDLKLSDDLKSVVAEVVKDYRTALDGIELHAALEAIWRALKACDQYIDTNEPWKLAKDETKADELTKVLGTLIEALRLIAWLLIPFMPETARKIFDALGFSNEESRAFSEAIVWGAQAAKPQPKKIAALFPRLDADT